MAHLKLCPVYLLQPALLLRSSLLEVITVSSSEYHQGLMMHGDFRISFGVYRCLDMRFLLDNVTGHAASKSSAVGLVFASEQSTCARDGRHK